MRRVSAFGIILLLSAGSAFAQPGPVAAPGAASHRTKASANLVVPCAGQFEKFCSAVPMGAGRKLICMKQHIAQLTPACRERIDSMFKLETELAAKNHMTMAQYMEWGQNFHEGAVKDPKDYEVVHAPAAKTPPPSQPKPPAPKPN